MKKMSQSFLLTLAFVANAWGTGFETVPVPQGKLTPFWLTPVSDKTKLGKLKKSTSVVVKSFHAMKYPVTVSQFQKFIEENPQWSAQNAPLIYADQGYLEFWNQQLQSLKSPVVQVSWFAARAFCQAQNMRLPTVNEWEYMAAASEVKKDANKDEAFLRRILDWYGEPRESNLKSVGSIYQNLYGIWDMHGLIWEWVEDFNTIFVTGESREDSSFNKNMFCGAGAMSGGDKENYAAFMRFAFRSSLKGKSSAWNLGFRCVK